MTTINIVRPSPLEYSSNRKELDDQLSPSRSARDSQGVVSRWKSESEGARLHPDLRALLDVAYGTSANQKLDIYTKRESAGRGLLPIHVFLHGGFWQEGSKDMFAFPAPAFVAAGWVYAAVGYTLAPHSELGAIVQEIGKAIGFVADNSRAFGGDPTRIVVSGHSAGGHLAACLITEDIGLKGVPRIAGIVPISGIFDLAPISASYVNDVVGLTAGEVHRLSPSYRRPVCDIPVRLVVGERETAEFIRQTETMAESWAVHLTDLETLVVPDRDHFDLLLDLADPSSSVFQLITTMAK